MKRSGRASLSAWLILAYTLVIVYASVQPFSGWRLPPPEVYAFLTAPWPRYLTAGDIGLNVVAYLPFGALLFFALRPPLAAAFALALATALGAALSLALESVQMFLPTRIASNVDLIANTFGAAIGALVALLTDLSNNPLAPLRARLVRPGRIGDWGLVIVALWILVQFHASTVALGTGNWRDTFGFTAGFMHSSQAYLLSEAAIVALTLTGLGLLVSLLITHRSAALRVLLLVLGLTAIAKSIAAAAIARSGSWLQWVTPGVAAGIAAGTFAAGLFIWLPPRARAIAGLLCIAAAVITINVMPENPYQTLPAYLSNVPPTHLANFSGIVRILAQCWPLAALMWLIAVLRAGPARHLR